MQALDYIESLLSRYEEFLTRESEDARLVAIRESLPLSNDVHRRKCDTRRLKSSSSVNHEYKEQYGSSNESKPLRYFAAYNLTKASMARFGCNMRMFSEPLDDHYDKRIAVLNVQPAPDINIKQFRKYFAFLRRLRILMDLEEANASKHSKEILRRGELAKDYLEYKRGKNPDKAKDILVKKLKDADSVFPTEEEIRMPPPRVPLKPSMITEKKGSKHFDLEALRWPEHRTGGPVKLRKPRFNLTSRVIPLYAVQLAAEEYLITEATNKAMSRIERMVNAAIQYGVQTLTASALMWVLIWGAGIRLSPLPP